MTTSDILFLVFSLGSLVGFILWQTVSTDKHNRVRYASIKNDMKPGIRYPRWRLEEMLAEKRDEK